MLEKLKFWTKTNNLKTDSQKNFSCNVSFEGVMNDCADKKQVETGSSCKACAKYAVPKEEKPQSNIPSYYYPNIHTTAENVEKYAVPDEPPKPIYAVPDESQTVKDSSQNTSKK